MGEKSSTQNKASCPTTGCPLCTKEGIALIGIGLLVAFLMPPPLGFIGFIIIGIAYFLPSIKKQLQTKNIN